MTKDEREQYEKEFESRTGIDLRGTTADGEALIRVLLRLETAITRERAADRQAVHRLADSINKLISED